MPGEHAGQKMTTAPTPGASNPHACEDAPPRELKQKATQLVLDDTLASLAQCTKRLTSPGSLEIALLFDKDSANGRAFATRSTVVDCRVVACVKEHLAHVQRPSSSPMPKNIRYEQFTLVPGGPVQHVSNVDWPLGKSHACTDPDEELSEFQHGRLEPVKIQSIIRERYPAFRRCYEGGLASNPNLSGRVTIRFVIGRDGHVSHAYIEGNEVPDCRVAQCVREEMTKSVFPTPEGGIVTVVYPIEFSPG